MTSSPDTTNSRFDALVVGGGISGLYQLYTLREAGLSVRLLEAGSGVGGTWYWNRYPGARFDSESYTYGYFFSDILHEEWTWSEEYAAQPETERYLNFVVDRFDMRPQIQLNTSVASAHWDADTTTWNVVTTDGEKFTATYLVTALGILSAPQFPRTPGLETYRGEWHHTGLWPHEDVDFTDKRVAVIGTGSSGVQIIPFIARDATSLTVFQRTPNWCTPINNTAITPERADEIRSTIAEIYANCLTTPAGGVYKPMAKSVFDVSEHEREAEFDRLYNSSGLSMALANFRDVSTNKDANAALTDYLGAKIRSRVTDQAIADKLIPTDHGFGQKRPPLENNYYEVYNRDNVTLVSTDEDPMETFTETGLRTTAREWDFDLVVFATGFEAVTGSYDKIDIRGVDGETLADHWSDGPSTYLGLQSAGFPNLFFVGGPQSTAGTIPRVTETQADWVTACIVHARSAGHASIGTTSEAEAEWNEHVDSGIRGTLQEDAESWAFGSNVSGKRRAYLLYAGGQPLYRTKIAEARDENYRGFVFS